ncbi:MAG: glycine cleavage system protein H [Chloroflexi bacterium]|nr:glycine cleavage system protein H [Chloroflexota bacterium]MBU1751433.1 glycine cleavage system protein H [Chloroflexota bacterium]MBU1880230.1 glycine cleavage system protein H [Chloroflexota bacterium]
MSEYLETTYDKFTFQVKTGYRYSPDDVWVRWDDGQATVGLTDFLQRRSGDVAFAELPAVGQAVVAGETCGVIETIKAAQDIWAPLSGTVTAINEELELRPELINEDPYAAGWLFQMAPADPAAIDRDLLSDQGYFQLMLGKVEEEVQRLGR